MLDASVAAAWYLAGQATSTAVEFFNLSPPPVWRAPHCFYYEVNDFLLRQERRGVLAARATEQIASDLKYRLGVLIEAPANDGQMALAIVLARTHAVSLFDGFYLLLAMELAAPLVTRDAGLAAAARRELCEAVYVGEAA